MVARLCSPALVAALGLLVLTPMRAGAVEAAPARVAAELTVTPAKGLERSFTFTLTLANTGSVPVTLVQPGDGSEVGWRTPIVTWRVTRKGTVPEVISQKGGGRCGNMNPLRAGEVFTLEPGQRRELTSWIGQPRFAGAGTYSVALDYQNDPLLTSRSSSAEDDPAELARVRKSTPMRVESNVVEIVVE